MLLYDSLTSVMSLPEESSMSARPSYTFYGVCSTVHSRHVLSLTSCSRFAKAETWETTADIHLGQWREKSSEERGWVASVCDPLSGKVPLNLSFLTTALTHASRPTAPRRSPHWVYPGSRRPGTICWHA